MKRITIFFAGFALLAGGALVSASGPAYPADPAMNEVRICGTPARDETGRIKRRADVLLAFRDLYPCPSTWKTRGACPGWNIDHIIPLACSGCDSVPNLQWLPVEIKRCAGAFCKDRWERKIYCTKQ
jgi:hypothetical protein